jgi:protein-S-isoprenylcysteine O-methyltransferase Ste14
LLLFGVFLLRGGFDWVRLGLNQPASLLFNGLLSGCFFVQHSVMIRRPCRERQERWVGPEHAPRLFDLVSGLTLLIVLLLWQGPLSTLASAHGEVRWLARGVFLAGLSLLAWSGVVLLRDKPRGLQLLGKPTADPTKPQLCQAGPYRWVRHPLYLASLLLIWSAPDLTSDRLLFNVMWSAYVLVGLQLEERDLIAVYGQAYEVYRARVPMLLPRPHR